MSRNERKEEYLALYREDLAEAFPNNTQALKDVDEVISIFQQSDLDDYIVWSLNCAIGDALDDKALTPRNLHRYLNALRAAAQA